MVLKKFPTGWILVISIACLLWLPHLLALGMFMDGIYDALLAQNLYLGVSTFWAPQTIYYSQPAYWDNPPLNMGLLALCYKVFGDHYAVERIYSFTCALIQLVLIARLWQTLFEDDEKLKSYSWLPCLLWLVSPLTGWSYSNNLMENTMSLFTTAAIIFSTSYVLKQGNMLIYALVVAVFLLLAFITKGPVALFLLALPVLMIGFIENYKWKSGISFSLVQLLFFSALLALLLCFDAPRTFFRQYLAVQLKPNLNHQISGEYVPYKIILELLIASSPFIALSLIRVLGRKSFRENPLLQKTSWRFLLLALCGSLPIVLSTKQRQFYLLPAMIAVVTGFAAYLLPMWQWVEEQANNKIKDWFETAIKISGLITIMTCFFLCFHNKGKITRDGDLLQDLKTVNGLIKGENLIRADWHLFGEWSLRGYLLRLYRKKLCMPNEIAQTDFYMTKPGEWGDKLPGNALKIYSGKQLDLYKMP